MIRQELSRWLGMFFFRNFLFVNIGFLLAGLCLSLIYYRAYRERDGDFRRCLLWYFGTGAFYCYTSAFFWHPFYNEWMQFVLVLPHLAALLHLTHFMLINFRGYMDEEPKDAKDKIILTRKQLREIFRDIITHHHEGKDQ